MTFTIIQTQRQQMKSFQNVNHLNESIRAYCYKFKKQLHNANTNYKELNAAGKVFKVLYTHSVKNPGVAYLSNKSIAKLTGLDIRTVKRATNKIQEIGIILKVSTKRPNGSDSSNTYVIKPLLSSIVDKLFKGKKGLDHPTLPPLESKSSKQNKNIKDINKRIERNSSINPDINFSELDKTYTGEYVPKEFASLVGCYYPKAQVIEEYWKMVKISTYHMNLNNETVLDLAINSFKQMINKLKKGRVQNTFAYFHGILHKKLNNLYLEIMVKEFPEFIK